jgi:hypothetical protein
MTGAGACVVDADQAGNGVYAPAPTVTRTIVVTKAATSLAVAPARYGFLSVTFSATLTSTVTHGPVPGETVAFNFLGRTLCSARTNASGVATCTLMPALFIIVGPASYTASYRGGSNYLPSTGTGSMKGLL